MLNDNLALTEEQSILLINKVKLEAKRERLRKIISLSLAVIIVLIVMYYVQIRITNFLTR